MRRWIRWLPLALALLVVAVAVVVRHLDDHGGPHAHGATASAEDHGSAVDHGAADHVGHEVPAAPDGPPLLEIMRDLERDLAAVSSAIWREDGPGLAAAAGRVADHPRVGLDERTRIQAKLGTDFGRFAAADHAVHETALRLVAAAESGEIAAVLDAKAELDRGCVSCHQQFRERLVGR